VARDLDRREFESLLNEADGPSPLGTTLFDSMLGVAVRRWCAPVLDLDPHAPAEAYLARRRELGAAEVNRRFVSGTGIVDFLVDTGYQPQGLCSPDDLATMAGGTAHEIVRLESLGQEVLAAGASPDDFAGALENRLRSTGRASPPTGRVCSFRLPGPLPASWPVRWPRSARTRTGGTASPIRW